MTPAPADAAPAVPDEVFARVEALKANAAARGLDPAAICAVAAVQAAYADNLFLFETVEAARVGAASQDDAAAIVAAARNDPGDFPAEIPSTPKLLERLPADGYLGLVTRADLPPTVAERLFADNVGPVVGPLAHDGRWWAYRVLLDKFPELNPVVYAWCEALLLERALSGGT